MQKNYVNLIDKLTSLEKQQLINFIDLYGINQEKFIGLDNWLQNWSHSNQKLYHLLGDRLIYKTKYQYSKNDREIYHEMGLLLSDHPFIDNYLHFCSDYIIPSSKEKKITCSNNSIYNFSDLLSIQDFFTNKISFSFKCKSNHNKKLLQIQAGSKPIKTLQKIIEYFKDVYNFDLIAFEDFKKAHSLILNDKIIKGNLCISILPLDFLTMSDNNSHWSSCLSWVEQGCYRIGTIEMMNSNNVLCCYIEAETPYCFYSKRTDDPSFCWNNKKWRNLFYITKDIIMNGKSYPYINDDINLTLLNIIKELAEKNLKWKYDFGPELYQDMKHINSTFSINRVRHYIKTKQTKKHNIIWDTRGMYNDILNNPTGKYWCYRNKVNQNKIISVSGKANCLCCGKDTILQRDYENEEEYNDKFLKCGEVICKECLNLFECEFCHTTDEHSSHIVVVDKKGIEYNLCEDCAKDFIKYCPDCGKPMLINTFMQSFAYKEPTQPYQQFRLYSLKEDFPQPACVCTECVSKYLPLLVKKKIILFITKREFYTFKNNKVEDRLLYKNLKNVPEKEYQNTILLNAATHDFIETLN